MSIQSTINITRETALDRIELIISLMNPIDYQAIDNITQEDSSIININAIIYEYVDSMNMTQWKTEYKRYTNEMLEDLMDVPYLRFTLFDNYHIGAEYEF